MNKKLAQRLSLRVVGISGLMLAAICASSNPTMAADSVTASGQGAVAAGRDVTINKNTTIKQYDTEKARSIESRRFASEMYRDCQQYLERVHAMHLDTRPGEVSDGNQPFIMSPLYQAPETRLKVGDQVFKELNAQQEKMKAVNNDVINMRLMRKMAPARAMLAKSGRKISLPGMSGPEPTPTGFEGKRKELETLTGAHCAYLKGLM